MGDIVVLVCCITGTDYERGREWALANPDGLAQTLAEAAGLSDEVAVRQLERTDLSVAAIGDGQRDTISTAGIALQEAGVIESDVDVAATVDALLDPSFTAPLEES